MNTENYRFDPPWIPSGTDLSNALIFHGDNDPTHSSSAVKAYMDGKTHNGTHISHGLVSPKPKPEHYWSCVGQRTEQKRANIQGRALNVLREAWRTNPEDHLKKLVESLAKRVHE